MFRQDQTGSKWIKIEQSSKIKLIPSNVMPFKRFQRIGRLKKYYFQKTGSNRIKQDQN
jgi:hypothetical protein